MTSILILPAATVLVASVASMLVIRNRTGHHTAQSAVYDRDTL